jgi:hypothetical protein
MPDDARESMLERLTERAHAVLPSVEEVLLAIDEDDEVRPIIAPLAVVLAIVVALVLGVGVAAVTASRPGGSSVALASPQPPSVAPSFSTGASPTLTRSPKPRRSATPSATSTASATQTGGPTGTPTSARPGVAGITIDPTSGPRGTTITVTGTGWTPGTLVTVRYSGTLAGSGSTAGVDDTGRFTTQITAGAPLPGGYTVTATDGSDTASQPFRQTS